MKLLIDDVKLNLLLTQKKQYIGKAVVWDSVLSSVSLLISVWLATFRDYFGVPGTALKVFFAIVGVAFTIKAVLDVRKSQKDKYTYEDLLKDINKLNEITHNHSIAVIKDTYNEFSNRYLVYEDKKWDCDFFMNYKDNANNEEFIKSRLSSELKINKDDITLRYFGSDIREKFSETAKKNKLYNHKFYFAEIASFPEPMKSDTFEIDGKTYKWRCISDMEQDKKIQEKNMDILNVVKGMI